MVSVYDLPLVPWEGGPAYWEDFPTAAAAGMTDPSFFPRAVFLLSATPSHVATAKAAGINIAMDVEHDPGTFPLSNVTDEMLAMVSWPAAEVGDDPGVVGWFISDEADMGLGFPGADQFEWLEDQDAAIAARRALDDGRFCWANFGNGILRTYWADLTMHFFVQGVDGCSADKYTYTSPDVAQIIDGAHDAPDWPNGMPIAKAYSYGWQVGQVLRHEDQTHLRPIWTFIEARRPYLTETGARAIETYEMEGAVWSALIHEARGIAFFQHNNEPTEPNYAIVEIPEVTAKVTEISAKIDLLAPVLNTQSRYNTTREVNDFTYFEYSFGNGTDTMLKIYEDDVYVFAGIGMGHTLGTKVFTVPEGIAVTEVEVVGESRTIPVVAGQFSDSFPNEYTHHVYRLSGEAIDPPPVGSGEGPNLMVDGDETAVTWTVMQGGSETPVVWTRIEGGVEVPYVSE